MPAPTSFRSRLQYGILALPLAFGGIPLYLYAPDFYATEMGLSLATLGSVLLALRFFDAISDPLWGWLTDHFSNRRNLLLNSAFGAYLLGFVALFNPIDGAGVIWFSAAVLLATGGYSLLAIQLNSLGASWSSDERELVQINGSREAFGLLGLIVAAITPAILLNYFSKATAFSFVAAMLVILLSLSYSAFFRWVAKRNIQPASQAPPRALPKQLLGSTKTFFATYGVSALASACPAVLIVFFVRDYLNLEAWTGLFLILYFLSGIAFIPLWKRVAGTYGTSFSWAASMCLAIISFSGVLLLSPGDFWGFAAICLLSGVAFGAELTIPPTILAQYLHQSDELAHSGVAYSLIALLSKLALALSAGLMFWILELNQFTPGAGAENTDSARLSLLYCYGLIPLIIKSISLTMLVVFRGVKFNEKTDMQNILNLDRSYGH